MRGRIPTGISRVLELVSNEPNHYRFRLKFQSGQSAKRKINRMATGSPEGVTELLKKWSEGDEEALNQLTPLV